MTNTFGITARAYRWYADGTETGAAALAAENTQLDVSNLGDYPIVLRYGVQESGSGSASGATTDDYQLQYSKNGGAFTNVTAASTNVQGFTSADLTDAAATTQRLSAGTGSFIAGEIAEIDGLLTDWQLTANNHSELLFAIQFIAADTADGDVYTFRVLRNGAVFNTYSVTPQVTIQNVYTVTADAGGVPISGSAATLLYHRKLAADTGNVPINGTAATLGRRIALAASSGSVPIGGTDATLTHEEGAATLQADPGAVPIAGTAAGLRVNRQIVAEAGSVPITGTAASLEQNRRVAADTANVPVTGSSATLRTVRRVDAQPGSVPIGGTAAALLSTKRLAADPANVPIVGIAAALLYWHRLPADPGSVPIAGTGATLTHNQGGTAYTLSAASANVPIAGVAASLYVHRQLVASSANVPITGTAAMLAPTVSFAGGAASFVPKPQPQASAIGSGPSAAVVVETYPSAVIIEDEQ